MTRLYATGLIVLLGLTLIRTPPALAHERKDVAGLTVVFGAEPEPALTEEVQWLRWRFRATDTEQPFSAVEQAQATVTRNGKQFGPFEARGVRNQAGVLQTMHIFAEGGEYDVVLTFKKKADPQTYTMRSRIVSATARSCGSRSSTRAIRWVVNRSYGGGQAMGAAYGSPQRSRDVESLRLRPAGSRHLVGIRS